MQSYNFITETGTILPDTSDLLALVQSWYLAAFGSDLDLDPNTPQGLLIAGEVLALSGILQNNAALANQINPNLAGGIFLDAILQLTGAQRNPAVSTVVPGVLLQGVAGTVVPVGSQMSDTVYGALFESLNTVTLMGSPAQATVDFSAVVPGALSIDTGTLTQIITPVLGWDTGTNPNACTPGQATQSDPSAKTLRYNTLGVQGSSLAAAIIGALNEVTGVTSVGFAENPTGSPITVKGITLVAHSMYACVDGGSETHIAAAIMSKKSGGCNFNGNTSVSYTVPISGQVIDVLFDIPTPVSILAHITVSQGQYTGNLTNDTISAVLNYASGGLNGQSGFVVGANVSCFEIAGAIVSQLPGVYVHLVKTAVNSMSPSFSTDEITINLNEIAMITSSQITVYVT